MSIPIVIVAAFVAVAWKTGYFDLKDPKKLQDAAEKADDNPWIAPAFVVAYAVITTFAAPVSPLAYAGGAMFGTIRGSVAVWIGSLLGAGAGYWLARGIWKGPAMRLLSRYEEKLRALREGNTFLTVLRLQLLPILPFGIFNYASGVTDLPFVRYLAATAIGIIPGTVAAVYVGDRVAAGIKGNGKREFLIAAAVMLAMLLLSFLPTLIKKLRKASPPSA